MFAGRRLKLPMVITYGARLFAAAGLWAACVYLVYAYLGLKVLRVPFLPIATIGTAVAFYVGFKNNAATVAWPHQESRISHPRFPASFPFE